MVEVVRVNAQREPLALEGLTEFEILRALQGAVGGYIQVLRLLDGSIMVANEDGDLKNLPYNALASGLAGDQIVGDVVLMTAAEMWKYMGG